MEYFEVFAVADNRQYRMFAENFIHKLVICHIILSFLWTINLLADGSYVILAETT